MNFGLVSCLVALASFLMPQSPSQDESHIQWVAEALKKMQTVQVGMTRDQLDQIFDHDGGIYTAGSETYVYRRCPYFKVDVKFDTKAKGPIGTDKILRISRPYLEPPAYD